MTALHPSAHLPRTSGLAIAVAIAAALLILASPAPAGIGDMVKSAKKKVAQSTGERPAEANRPAGRVPEFNDRVLELTGPRLDQVLAGYKAAAAIVADRPRLIARQQSLQKEIDDLNAKHGEAIGAYMKKKNDDENCMREAIEENLQKRRKEMQQKMMTDRAEMEKFARLSLRFNEAQLKGDTASVRKLQAEILALDAPTRADTLVARQKCGPAPPPLPAALRMDAAQAELGNCGEQIRAVDYKAREARIDANGLTEDQIAIAIDRIVLYLAAMKQNQTPMGFTEAEIKALDAHRDALAAALGG